MLKASSQIWKCKYSQSPCLLRPSLAFVTRPSSIHTTPSNFIVLHISIHNALVHPPFDLCAIVLNLLCERLANMLLYSALAALLSFADHSSSNHQAQRLER